MHEAIRTVQAASRAMIADAMEGDTIVFDDSLSGLTIVLDAASPLVVDKDLTIDGSSLPDPITISGNDASQVFFIFKNGGDPKLVSMNDFTIANGSAARGGGIKNFENLTLTNMSLVGNNASFRGGAISNSSSSTLMVFNSTFDTNSADATSGAGGGIQNNGTATITNSTFIGNEARFGAAIYMEYGTTLIHCTISGNTSTGSAVRLNGGNATLDIENTIVAGNTPEIRQINNTSGTVKPTGVNLIGSNDSVTTEFPSDGVLVGTSGTPVLPLLGALADNGGPTQTLFPDPLSPAIDAAVLSSLTLDQRGVARPQEAGFDLGAVEDNTAELDRIARSLAAKKASLQRKINKVKRQIRAAKRKKAKKLNKSLKKYLRQLRAL